MRRRVPAGRPTTLERDLVVQVGGEVLPRPRTLAARTRRESAAAAAARRTAVVAAVASARLAVAFADQSGQEKFSTEVVLQKFRGELTMLDGKGDGAEQGGDYGASSGGGGGFSSGPSRQGSGPREDFSADLDDEIPF